jgi:hypothetical protein
MMIMIPQCNFYILITWNGDANGTDRGSGARLVLRA